LLHLRVPISRRSHRLDSHQVVLPETMYQQILGIYHDSSLGGHDGIQDTLDKIKDRTWDDILPGIVFAMNSAVNSSTGYSSFEINFGTRPNFPLLSNTHYLDLNNIPEDYHAYMEKTVPHLQEIQQEMQQNVNKAKSVMLERANEFSRPLKVDIDDYVYCLREQTGFGKGKFTTNMVHLWYTNYVPITLLGKVTSAVNKPITLCDSSTQTPRSLCITTIDNLNTKSKLFNSSRISRTQPTHRKPVRFQSLGMSIEVWCNL